VREGGNPALSLEVHFTCGHPLAHVIHRHILTSGRVTSFCDSEMGFCLTYYATAADLCPAVFGLIRTLFNDVLRSKGVIYCPIRCGEDYERRF